MNRIDFDDDVYKLCFKDGTLGAETAIKLCEAIAARIEEETIIRCSQTIEKLTAKFSLKGAFIWSSSFAGFG